jgi:uncharacterized SAM-binding protein YcdF (DUF218 family)
MKRRDREIESNPSSGRDSTLPELSPRTTAPRRCPPVALSPRLGREAAWGAALGALVWLAARDVGIGLVPAVNHTHVLALWALVGLCIGLTPARWLLRVAGITLAALLLAIGYVIPVGDLARGWERIETLPRLEAVVSLSTEVRQDATPNARAQIRLLRAYELLKSGHARRLIITRISPPAASTLPAVRAQMTRLGLAYPVEEVGPARNTREEAQAVAELGRRRGWKRVLLVTDPLHLRRAEAVFAAAGLDAYCAPSQPFDYDPAELDAPGTRWIVFREWLREYVGYQVYLRRGWIRDPTLATGGRP